VHATPSFAGVDGSAGGKGNAIGTGVGGVPASTAMRERWWRGVPIVSRRAASTSHFMTGELLPRMAQGC
jgi:hypothetical protein